MISRMIKCEVYMLSIDNCNAIGRFRKETETEFYFDSLFYISSNKFSFGSVAIRKKGVKVKRIAPYNDRMALVKEEIENDLL